MHLHQTLKVRFINGKENYVHVYPRNYVNLVNKYLNRNKKPYIINQKYISTWFTTPTNLTNKYIMSKAWKTWLNHSSGFGTNSKIYKNLKGNGPSAIRTFVAKSKLTPMTIIRTGHPVTPYARQMSARNLAARLMRRIRTGYENARKEKIKFAFKHALDYERAKKKYTSEWRRKPSNMYNLDFAY